MRLIKVTITIMALMILQKVSAQNAEAIKGRWRVDVEETVSRMNAAESTRISHLPVRAQEGLRKSLEGREFIFAGQNKMKLTFKLKDSSTKEVNGTWQYSESTNTLTTTTEESERKGTVTWEGPNKLIIAYVVSETQGLIKLLCLTRMN
jgi:hypothetical protein